MDINGFRCGYHLDWTSDVEIFLDGLFDEWCNVFIFGLCVCDDFDMASFDVSAE